MKRGAVKNCALSDSDPTTWLSEAGRNHMAIGVSIASPEEFLTAHPSQSPPWGTESHDIEQACNNAKSLSKWLTSAVG
jgi:hypothetical protein